MHFLFLIVTLFFLPIGVNRLALFLREAILGMCSESVDLSKNIDSEIIDETLEFTEVKVLGLTDGGLINLSYDVPLEYLIVGLLEP